ncbi:2Fe-2S iron-sulfur cluster-binding protein [Parasporobacterium paucivorans]|uniref:2Fe-2S iron-sulfur cluster binding domain-containing protein n=1 Tax=Parasporobacterium paucivorans DSM 15970 TaxID=1122934 RepID=A0A1M6HYD0_9FIRM|nr:2Fe-2S iron-sulfur cluster-binding protein [Parasporobacterium paucivorans]SHJ27137.1 2Fe-2S iron-sulfur cluster binding domain-containing protein [Parasporobacterium paucivorans DSM 15970]
MAKVTFISETEVKQGKSLLKAAGDANIKLKTSCDGKGKCGKCVVKVVSGELTEPTKSEIDILGNKKIKEGYRLACQADVTGDKVVVITKE